MPQKSPGPSVRLGCKCPKANVLRMSSQGRPARELKKQKYDREKEGSQSACHCRKSLHTGTLEFKLQLSMKGAEISYSCTSHWQNQVSAPLTLFAKVELHMMAPRIPNTCTFICFHLKMKTKLQRD